MYQNFEEIVQTPTFVWLERFHINNYVQMDHRQFNRPITRGRSNGGLEKAIKKAEFSYHLRRKKLESLCDES